MNNCGRAAHSNSHVRQVRSYLCERFFLVLPLQELNGVNSNYNSPFLMCLDFGVCAPQSASFALATTHSLDVLLNASRPYHRSPSACLEGTHGDRVAGDNTNAIDFVTIASSLCATSSTRIDCYRSLFMSLVRGRKESKLVRSLVLHIKLGVRLARRRCGSCSVFEVAHSVNKHALNE